MLLAINGAITSQIASAAGSIVVISALCGRPYGLFLQWCRKLFRLPSEPESGRPEAAEKDVPSP